MSRRADVDVAILKAASVGGRDLAGWPPLAQLLQEIARLDAEIRSGTLTTRQRDLASGAIDALRWAAGERGIVAPSALVRLP